jgi:hypothetical protein
VLSRWEKYTAALEASKAPSAVRDLFPFASFFSDAPGALFGGTDRAADWDAAQGCWRHLRTLFQASHGGLGAPRRGPLRPIVTHCGPLWLIVGLILCRQIPAVIAGQAWPCFAAKHGAARAWAACIASSARGAAHADVVSPLNRPLPPPPPPQPPPQELEECRAFELLKGQGDRVNYLSTCQARSFSGEGDDVCGRGAAGRFLGGGAGRRGRRRRRRGVFWEGGFWVVFASAPAAVWGRGNVPIANTNRNLNPSIRKPRSHPSTGQGGGHDLHPRCPEAARVPGACIQVGAFGFGLLFGFGALRNANREQHTLAGAWGAAERAGRTRGGAFAGGAD